jgi:hypothetical protein
MPNADLSAFALPDFGQVFTNRRVDIQATGFR